MNLVFVEAQLNDATKLPFSRAVYVENILYLSGVIGTVPGKLELVPGGMEEEARQTMVNIDTILRENQSCLDDVFKCTVMLSDMSKWSDFNRVYITYFNPDRLPVR